MNKPSFTRFIFDASGLMGVLEAKYGDSDRMLPGRKLSQLAQRGMMTVPPTAANEAAANSNKAKDWLERNRRHVQVSEQLKCEVHKPTVEETGANLPGFAESTADVEGVCVALALVRGEREQQDTVSHYLVVHDIAYEAVCVLLGLSTVRPEAFVEAFGALPIALVPP